MSGADIFAFVGGAIQLAAIGITATKKIGQVYTGYNDKRRVPEYKMEIDNCQKVLSNVQATYQQIPVMWTSLDLPKEAEDAVKEVSESIKRLGDTFIIHSSPVCTNISQSHQGAHGLPRRSREGPPENTKECIIYSSVC